MNFKSRLTTAIATGAVLLNALAPVAFAQDVTITGNAASSVNTANVTNASTTTVNQTNTALVTNTVSSNASTGNNTASFNNGGNTGISTGNATTNVGVSNALNVNSASVGCCVAGGNTNVTISDNHVSTTNTANVTNANTTVLGQTNLAVVGNVVGANSSTGNNTSSFNNGGNTAISTGNASTTVDVATAANANVVKVGGGAGVMPGSGNSVTIVGNGPFSVNTVNLTDASTLVLGQTNNAAVSNLVSANANTGGNTASFNNGGDVSIVTHNAKTNVGVHNLLNFNGADIDCECLLGGADVKIGGNATSSVNTVRDIEADVLVVGQGNLGTLLNLVGGNADSGLNTSSFNNVGSDGDPSVVTGNAEDNTGVSNTGNANWFDNGSVLSLPGNWDLVLSFSWFGLLPWWA